MGLKTKSILHEKVSLCIVVGKKPTVARVDSAGKLDSHSDRRPRKGKLSQRKENSLIVRFPSQGNVFLAEGCLLEIFKVGVDIFKFLRGFFTTIMSQF